MQAVMAAKTFFPEQVTTGQFASNILYWLSTGGVIVALFGLLLVDIGLVQRRNLLDTCIQKMVGFFIGTFSYLFIGFGIWNWQFYDAFGVANPYGKAISDWWLGGAGLTHFAHALDSTAFAGANNSQIFVAFLAVYAGFVCVLVSFGGSERMKPSAYYILSAVIGAVVYPLLLWLTWGSTSPLTNLGVHDLVGDFVGYIFAGTLGVFLAWRLRPRAGLFAPQRDGTAWAPYNLAMSAIGVVILLFAIPLVVLGCGYFIPGTGYLGISMTTSGFGIVVANVYVAFTGGALVGALLSYRTKDPVHVLLGPISGYIVGTAGFDVLMPWQTLIISLFGPLFVGGVYQWFHNKGLDESKVGPLGAAGLFGAIVVGFIDWGVKTGGYVGIDKGPFAFQHAQITPWWQLVGAGVAIGAALLTGLVVLALEKTIGIRVGEDQEDVGLDTDYWSIPPVGAELLPLVPGAASAPAEPHDAGAPAGVTPTPA